MKTGSIIATLIFSLAFVSVLHAQSARRAPNEFQADDAVRSITGELVSVKQEQEKIEDAIAPGDRQEKNDQEKKPANNQVKPDEVLKNRPIMDIKVSPNDPSSKRPKDRFAEFDISKFPRNLPVYPQRLVTWEAPNILYNPLYFEDVVLERYGQTYGPLGQPWVSAVRFFGSATVLPYNALIDRPYSCETPLGYCRPGNWVPTQKQRLILRK